MNTKTIAALVLGLSLTSALALADEITSVSQLKDVPRSEPYFQDIQSLVERYGIIQQATYRPSSAISKAEFATLLNTTLDKFSEVVASIDGAKNPLKFPGSSKKTVSQYTDVKPTDTYYPALKSLTERYGIAFGSKDGKFNAQETVTQQQAAGLFGMIFGIKTLPSSDKPLTRGEMAMFLNASLNYASAELEKTLLPAED